MIGDCRFFGPRERPSSHKTCNCLQRYYRPCRFTLYVRSVLRCADISICPANRSIRGIRCGTIYVEAHCPTYEATRSLQHLRQDGLKSAFQIGEPGTRKNQARTQRHRILRSLEQRKTGKETRSNQRNQAELLNAEPRK